MTIDVDRARRETPGSEHLLHFNNAGMSLTPAPVLDAVISHLRLEAEIGGYEAEERSERALDATYQAVSRLIGAGPEEIALVENASRAWTQAFYALPLSRGDRVLTSMAEYSTNYIGLLHRAASTGAIIEPIPNDAHGQISLEALSAALDPWVKLIAITHVPTSGGLVNPAAQVGKIAREAGVPFLLDACQSAGQMPLNVGALNCDLLAATGRKFLRGPRGTGFLYVRRGMLDRLKPVTLDNRSASWNGPDSFTPSPTARRFETYESNMAARIGLGVAVEYALGWGLDQIRDRVYFLAGLLREQLGRIPRVTLRDQGLEQCGIVTFSVLGRPPEEIRAGLSARSINVWVSHRGDAQLDLGARGFDGVVRASVHYYNTESEIERFCDAVHTIST